jgi:ribosomal protein L11 methyltransferase
MGFGTGHHATTRLCLQALQEIGVAGRDVLDVGTGSGVLAIAAALLGAADVLAVDNDPDAIQNARDNRALNPAAARVRIELVDAAAGLGASTADVVTANLTAAQLIRARDQIVGATRRGGAMILSGVLTTERAGVEAAFAPARVTASLQEDEWAALVLTL